MGANKEKQNLRYKKVCERINKKVRLDGFTPEERKVIKTKQSYEQFEKELNRFWAEAPRKDNNNVNWDIMSEQQLDYFEYINKKHDSLLKKLSKYEDNGINIDDIMILFMKLNINSVCY